MKLIITVVATAVAMAFGGYVLAPNYRVERCLYEAVSAYPALPADKTALDTVPACERVSGPDKQRLREMVSKFIMSAADKAARGE
jgi:hypothetical protein